MQDGKRFVMTRMYQICKKNIVEEFDFPENVIKVFLASPVSNLGGTSPPMLEH